MYKATALLLAASTLLSSMTTIADTVTIPLGQQGEQSVDRPPRGTNKAQVVAVYGEPDEKHGPNGQPPIYSWEYPEYTVYFEGDFVLHSVVKHQKTAE